MSLARQVGRTLARRIPTGMPVPILSGPLRGRRWQAGANAGEGKGLSIVVNRYEPAQLATAAELVEPGSVCFDIGANAGLYALLFAKRAAHVYAFEPFPSNIARLCSTLRLNRVDNVTVVPCAVGASNTLVGFAEGVNHATGAIAPHGRQPAACLTCDEFCARFAVIPSTIKIDVEGAELDVLHGAKTTLTTSRPTLLLSVHSDDLRRECLTYLRSIGYTHGASLTNVEANQTFETEFLLTASPDRYARLNLTWTSTDTLAAHLP